MSKPITAKDIGLTKPIDVTVKFDSSNIELWNQMWKIHSVFGKPIDTKFVDSNSVNATDDEIRQFDETMKPIHEKAAEKAAAAVKQMIATLEEELNAEGLSEDKKLDIEKKLKNIRPEPSSTDNAEKDDSIAKYFIKGWKYNRALFRKYGGRIISQQAGPEALDARRILYKEAEKDGDLKFNDEGVKHLFYYYYNMQHVVIKDKKVFEEQPWFFKGASAKPLK